MQVASAESLSRAVSPAESALSSGQIDASIASASGLRQILASQTIRHVENFKAILIAQINEISETCLGCLCQVDQIKRRRHLIDHAVQAAELCRTHVDNVVWLHPELV